jgi:hypothetical protein
VHAASLEDPDRVIVVSEHRVDAQRGGQASKDVGDGVDVLKAGVHVVSSQRDGVARELPRPLDGLSNMGRWDAPAKMKVGELHDPEAFQPRIEVGDFDGDLGDFQPKGFNVSPVAQPGPTPAEQLRDGPTFQQRSPT